LRLSYQMKCSTPPSADTSAQNWWPLPAFRSVGSISLGVVVAPVAPLSRMK
jgi:hypothetical protein